jgi:hypothetical protein
MTIARAYLVDPALSPWYHCVTRCVRRAFLLGDEHQDRKPWIERWLQELALIFRAARWATLIMQTGFAVRVPPCYGFPVPGEEIANHVVHPPSAIAGWRYRIICQHVNLR